MPTQVVHLPFQPTRLFGRRREVNAARRLLASDDVRLLTITGTGGVGKSRLAVEICAGLASLFPDGVWFVDLSTISDPGLVMSQIAEALGVKGSGHAPLSVMLKDYLSERRVLIALDSFEHLLAASADLSDLLGATRALKFLMTSRERLRLRWEHVLVLGPLETPRPEPLPALTALTQISSVALFVDRATAVRPDFALNEENLRAVANLCIRLDGLPLAIKLAAARSAVLSPNAILKRLEQRLSLLQWAAADLPPRHQSLRTAVEWSYDLLSPTEQSIFRRLAVFRGGFTLDACEEVTETAALRVDTLATLTSLVDKALVQVADEPSGEPRFRLLDALREFAWERLDASDELGATRSRHLEYCLVLAERAAPGLETDEQAACVRALQREHDNLRAALTWSAETSDVDRELRLAGKLAYFWWMAGYLREGCYWLDDALQRSTGRADALRLNALGGFGFLASYMGEYAAARIRLEEALVLAKRLDDERSVTRTLCMLLMTAYLQGRSEDWRTLASNLESARHRADPQNLYFALHCLGMMAHETGDDAAAIGFLEDGLGVCERAGDPSSVAAARGCLALIASAQGALVRACGQATEALRLAQERGHLVVLAWCGHVAVRVAAPRLTPATLAPLIGAADALASAASLRISPIQQAKYAQLSASVRAALGERAFTSAHAAGRAMTTTAFVQATIGALQSNALDRDGSNQPSGASNDTLSEREHEVLRLLAGGQSNRAIGDVLGISENTTKFHVKAIFRKLGATTRAEAVALAAKGDLL